MIDGDRARAKPPPDTACQMPRMLLLLCTIWCVYCLVPVMWMVIFSGALDPRSSTELSTLQVGVRGRWGIALDVQPSD